MTKTVGETALKIENHLRKVWGLSQVFSEINFTDNDEKAKLRSYRE